MASFGHSRVLVLLASFFLWPSFSSPTAHPNYSPSSRLASFVASRSAPTPAHHVRAGLRIARTPVPACGESSHLPQRTQRAGAATTVSVARGGGDDDDARDDSTGRGRADSLSLTLTLTYLTVMGAKCALPSTLALLVAPESGLVHRHASLSRHDVVSRLLALSTLSIAAGKLVLGPVIDALGGVRSLRLALAALGLCLGAIGSARACPSLTALASFWIVVDFAFSSCWAASVKAIRDHLPEELWSREIGRLAAAARSGNALSFAFFAWLLQRASPGASAPAAGAAPAAAPWRWVFRAAAAAQLPPLALLSRHSCREGRRPAAERTGNHAARPTAAWKASLAVLRQQVHTLEFWLHLVSRSIAMVLVSFLLFVPSYMSTCYEMTSAASARVGSMFALGCLLSVSTLAEKTYPSADAESRTSRQLARRKACAMVAFLSLAATCLALQASFLHNLIRLSPFLGTLLMFLLGFSLAIPFYLPSSMFALKRGGKDGSATIADAFDVCGFGILAFFNGFVARVLDAGGHGGSAERLLARKRAWLPVFSWMLGGTVVAMVALFGAVWLEGERGDPRGILGTPAE